MRRCRRSNIIDGLQAGGPAPTSVSNQVAASETAMFKRRKAQPTADPAIYDDLRARVLTLAPAAAGLRKTDELPDVWGVLLETGHPEGSSTLVALADGTTSLYLSSGGGIIGGGEHEPVATATKRLVGAAQQEIDAFPPAEDQDPPPAGQATIRVLTYDGARSIQAEEADFGEGRHDQSDLFYKVMPSGKARESTRSSAISGPASGNSRAPWPTTTGQTSRLSSSTSSF